MRANVQRPFPHQAGKIPTPAHFRGNFAARQTASVPTAPTAPAQGHFRGNFTGMSDCSPVSSAPPHPRRAAPGKTSQAQKPRRSRRPQGHAPSDDTTLADPSNHSGQTSRPIRTARPSAQPHRARAELLRGKLHKDESYCPTDGTTACRANRPRCIRAELRRGKLRGPADCPCTDRSHRAHAGPFQGKTPQAHQDSPPVSSTPPHPRRATSEKTSQGRKLLPDRRHNSLPCQPSPLHSRRTTPGKTSRPGRLPLYRPIPSRPRRVISGEISQACQTARLSAQPHRIRAGLLREKLHKPKNHSAADGPKATPHQTTQRSPTRPTILVKLRGP